MSLYQLFMVDNCWGVIKQVLITDSKLSAWDALNIGAISVEDNSSPPSIWSVLWGQLCNWLMPGCQSHMVFVAICRISSHYLQLVYITVCNLTLRYPDPHLHRNTRRNADLPKKIWWQYCWLFALFKGSWWCLWVTRVWPEPCVSPKCLSPPFCTQKWVLPVSLF